MNNHCTGTCHRKKFSQILDYVQFMLTTDMSERCDLRVNRLDLIGIGMAISGRTLNEQQVPTRRTNSILPARECQN